jgi:hypothetical protein
MATVHSTRTCLPKLCCSLAAVGLFITGILITGAYPHSNLDSFNRNQTHQEQNLTSPGNFTLAAERLAFSQADNQERRIPELADRISNSPRAIRTIQTLEDAIAMFGRNKPEPEYQISEHATGNRRWKRAPIFHPMLLTELLKYDVQEKHNRNEILGAKVAQILKQNTDLSDKITNEYQNPSEKLKKDPIMALVRRTISTYMLIKPSEANKENSKEENLPTWGEPFFSKPDHAAKHRDTSRRPRSPGHSDTTKEESATPWFLRHLVEATFPFQSILPLGKALNFLTNSSPKN